MGHLVRSTVRSLWRLPRAAAARLRAARGLGTDRPPAWEATLLDDLAFNRPWNLVVKALRLRARIVRRQPGVTIVIVNWNTQAVTRDTLHAVQKLSPPDVEILIVDNGSVDSSREWLRSEELVRVVALPANAGHAVALDIATLLSKTDTVVTLDSDAVPLCVGWLDVVLDPLKTDGVILAGLTSQRHFVHPSFAALDVDAFISKNLSHQVWRLPGVANDERVWGENTWDTGELMTARLESDEYVLISRTPNPVAGLAGMTAGGVVYHHGGITRATEDADLDLTNLSYRTWRNALEQLLPEEALAAQSS